MIGTVSLDNGKEMKIRPISLSNVNTSLHIRQDTSSSSRTIKMLTMHKTEEDLVLEQGIDNKPFWGFIEDYFESI